MSMPEQALAPPQESLQLNALPDGTRCRIHTITGSGPIRQRLLDMGLLPDVELQVERRAPGGDPIWIRLGSWQMALRKAEATSILVLPVRDA